MKYHFRPIHFFTIYQGRVEKYTFLSGMKGTLGFVYNTPRFFFLNNTILYVGLENLGTFYWIWIGWFIKLSVQTFQPLIGHCLIPLDPCILIPCYAQIQRQSLVKTLSTNFLPQFIKNKFGVSHIRFGFGFLGLSHKLLAERGLYLW